MTKLSEDILFDIFLRLGQDSIFKCKGVSKVWHSVISNPAFVSKWLAKYTGADNFIAWFVVYNTHCLQNINANVLKKNSNADILASTTTPNYYRTPVLNTRDGRNFEFLCGSITFKENQFCLGSSYGLALCQETTKTSDSTLAASRFLSQIFGTAFSENSWGYNHPDLRYYQDTYYVCNLFTGKDISIPRPSDKWIAGHCIISRPSIAFRSRSTTVVRIPQIWTPSNEFDLEVYSSDNDAWETRRVSCPPGTTVTIKTFTSLNVVAHSGVLYWINGEKSAEITTIDIRNYKGSDSLYQCRALRLPVEYDRDGCLGAQLNGHLCYCSVSNHKLNLWELRLVENYCNEDEWDWYLVHEDVDISNISNYYKLAALNSLDRDIVLLRSCNLWNDFLTYNILTRRIEKLES